MLALVGRSGTGKTTILKLINRLLLPQTGTVRVEGRATSEWDGVALRRRVGYVLQEVGLFPHLTIARNVAIVPELEGWERTRIDARVNELFALVGLEPKTYRDRLSAPAFRRAAATRGRGAGARRRPADPVDG